MAAPFSVPSARSMQTVPMDVDQEISAFVGAVAATGLPVAQPGHDASLLKAIDELVAPLRVPPTLRRLWERVAVGELWIGPDPGPVWPTERDFAHPYFSWFAYANVRYGPSRLPATLIPVAGVAPRFRLVELVGPERTGGGVFDWSTGTDELVPVYASVEHWLEVLTAVLVDGDFRAVSMGGAVGWVFPDSTAVRRQAAGRLVDLGRLPVLAGKPPPAPSVMSASRLLWELPPAASVAGFVRPVTTGERGQRVELVDGTALLDLWCPLDVPGRWLLEHHRAFELDVSTVPGAWAPESSEKEPDWINDYVLRLPPHATVTAIRLRELG